MESKVNFNMIHHYIVDMQIDKIFKKAKNLF